jgi:hypothetical protein
MSDDLTPPLPVVAYASDDTSELYTPAELADYIIERPVPLVRKADADAAIASLQARLDAMRERCAVAAWSAGMDAHNAARGLPIDARHVGGECAKAIRAIDAATQEQPT